MFSGSRLIWDINGVAPAWANPFIRPRRGESGAMTSILSSGLYAFQANWNEAKNRVGGRRLKIRIRRGRDCSSEQEGKGIQSVLSAASAGTEETTAGRLLPLSVTLI